MADNIEKITIIDKEYPLLLKKIEDPPQALYFRGNIACLKENCFAIVGTRLCSNYGKEAALEIAGDLSRAGLVIVSGLAPGIDTFAHLAAVENNKMTIAVLGTGPDEKSLYPKSNIRLSKKIIEQGGCLVSEYLPGTHGSKLTFPARNRIVSGLSLGILVIEAKYKSGALITANFARKQKKKLFALPGPIYSLNSQGPNLLIKTGAILAENSRDILKELNLTTETAKTKSDPTVINGKTPEENLLLACLKQGSATADQIIEKTKLPASKIISCLTILEIEGKVRNLGQNIYALVR